MKTLQITRDELDHVQNLQRKNHWKWPAAFSANEYGDIWPYVTRGYTQYSARDNIRGVCNLIDSVADEYIRSRPGGGRFFLNSTGAFFSPQGEDEVQFLKFRMKRLHLNGTTVKRKRATRPLRRKLAALVEHASQPSHALAISPWE